MNSPSNASSAGTTGSSGSAGAQQAAAPLLWALPLQLAQAALGLAERFSPPAWLVAEAQAKLVLLINHVLQGETEAMARLKRHAGKSIEVRWRMFDMGVQISPVGLLDTQDAATAGRAPDLRLELTQTELSELAASVQSGQSPKLRIEGDVQLAAEVGWLSQHVRWDIEDDLARVLGDAAAATVMQLGRALAQGLKARTAA
jgi:ubiquinone biosynthesis accessory factor UbiJ